MKSTIVTGWIFGGCFCFFFQRNSGFHLSIWTRFNMEKQHVTDLKEVGWWFFVGSFNSPITKSEAPFLLFSGCFGDVVSHTLIPKNIGSSHPKSLKKPRMGLMDDELWGDDFWFPRRKTIRTVLLQGCLLVRPCKYLDGHGPFWCFEFFDSQCHIMTISSLVTSLVSRVNSTLNCCFHLAAEGNIVIAWCVHWHRREVC